MRFGPKTFIVCLVGEKKGERKEITKTD
jgi:hypothetical protein